MAISKRSTLSLFQRPVIAVVVLGLLALIEVGVRARVWRNFRSANNSFQELLPPAPGPAQMVRFTVYDAGIFPREAHAGPGLVALYFEDMSGDSAGLVVASESLQTVAQVVRSPGRWRGKVRVSLLAGRYTVYDASRPTNRATLIIEP
jgi:hypothetical protein